MSGTNVYCNKCGKTLPSSGICPYCSGGTKTFESLGNLDGTPIVPVTSPDKPANPTGSFFTSLGNLDGTPIVPQLTTSDPPVRPPRRLATEYVPEVPVKKKAPSKVWIPIAACAAVVVLVLVLLLIPRSDPFKTALLEKIDSERIHGTELPLSYQYSNAVVNSVEFKILKTDKEDLTATVRFTYVSVLELADEYEGSLSDMDAYYRYCVETIASGDAPTVTDTVEVCFQRSEADEDVLLVEDTLELADVLTGGVASVYQELMGGGK